MKRIKAACLEQTIHFQLREELGHEEAVRSVKEEYAHYKNHMERTRTKYEVMEELPQEDGSLVVKIKKQYNKYDCGDYIR